MSSDYNLPNPSSSSCLLAIDTSTDACSAALLTPALSEQRLSITPREHTQRLLPMVQALLQECNVSLTQLDAIAIGIGPGSFTGLRIGLSVAQGLAYGADLPIVPVSTLEAMAHSAWRQQFVAESQLIIPAIDARMNELYWSAYKASVGSLTVLHPETIAAPEALATESLLQGQAAVGVGSGWHYPSLQILDIDLAHDVYPEALDIAMLAQVAFSRGEYQQPLAVSPTYLREEVSWQKRRRIRSR